MPSSFPCSPVIRECLWKKTQIEKKKKKRKKKQGCHHYSRDKFSEFPYFFTEILLIFSWFSLILPLFKLANLVLILPHKLPDKSFSPHDKLFFNTGPAFLFFPLPGQNRSSIPHIRRKSGKNNVCFI